MAIRLSNILALLIITVLSGPWAAKAAELENIGNFSFPTSGSAEAQKHFILGVGYLHSFGWTQARDEFKKAQQIEPDFAMAYWGESLTYNHPLIGHEWAPDAPARVLNKLGKTTEERLAKAPTDREKGFILAAEAYAFNDKGRGAKRTAWMQSMKKLYKAYPDDREVAAFYAVSLLSAATAAGDQRQRLNMLAGSIALELFRENERHPGAAHYTIHAFDDPEHAPIALAAARQYIHIAPAVSHARHMPTHIFIQHGMWQKVADQNIASFQAAEDLWKPGNRPNDLNHSSSWGQYGDLQLAKYDHAKEWLKKAEKVLKENPNSFRSLETVKNMKARFIVESQQWQTSKITKDTNSAELLAIGLSAINLGDMDLASKTVDQLQERAAAKPDNTYLNITYKEVAALTLLKQGKTKQALALFDEGVALTALQAPPRGAARPHKPIHELYGEALLQSGKLKKAVTLFTQSLLRTPNRPWSVLGLARSYAKLAEHEKASEQYLKLTTIWKNKTLPGYQEAQAYLAKHAN